ARRGYIVPDAANGDALTAPSTSPDAVLGDLLRSVVPQGPLAVSAAVTAPPTSARSGRAAVVIRVEPATAKGQPVHVGLMTADAEGRVSNERGVRFDHPAVGDGWEMSFDLPLTRGRHQLRVAAVTADGLHTGLVTESITIAPPGRGLTMDTPML